MNPRVTAIDSVRGLMIILMILGHIRYFLLPISFDPIELDQGSVELYLLRVLTNMCAPIFFFLSGMGIFLLVRNHLNKTQASQDLIKRGLILIAFDLLYISWIIFWPTDSYTMYFGVLWALGMSMLILSFLIYLPIPWMSAIVVMVLLGHNMLDYFFTFDFSGTLSSFLLMLLHGTITQIELNNFLNISFRYAVVPWFAVMLLGYVLGSYLLSPTMTSSQRQRILMYLGCGLLVFFIILRTLLGYGDMVQWSWESDSGIFSWLYLFKITKYPPSLQYISLVLGVGCLLLAMFDRYQPPIGQYLSVFGKTALFLYIVHIPIVTALGWVWHKFVLGENLGDAAYLNVPLIWIFLSWLLLLLPLYWLCKWYRPIKIKYI